MRLLNPLKYTIKDIYLNYCRLCDAFSQLEYSKESFDIPVPYLLMEAERVKTIHLCKTFINNQDALRGDYKEFASLALLYLKDEETLASFEKFLKPGAVHSARWMAKLLYSVKGVLLAPSISKLPPGTVFGRGQLEKLQAFVKFSIFVYLPWWLSCHSSTSASLQDLLLLQKLSKWEDKAIQEKGMIAMKRHL